MHAGNLCEDGRLEPVIDKTKTADQLRPYLPQVHMWPPGSTPLKCTVTCSAPRSFILVQGDPAVWERGATPRPIASAPRVPFLLVRAPGFVAITPLPPFSSSMGGRCVGAVDLHSWLGLKMDVGRRYSAHGRGVFRGSTASIYALSGAEKM